MVILFDEAHYLLGDKKIKVGKENEDQEQVDEKEKEKVIKAFLFRLVRLWICKKRPNEEIVAVFTGTTSALTNFIIEDDFATELKTNMRNAEIFLKIISTRRRCSYDPF